MTKMPERAQVLWVVARVLAARSLDELFDRASDRAAAVHVVPADLAQGRAGRWHGVLASAARRRGIGPQWAAGRVAVLLAALEARRRDDLYRALGVPPLAPAETIAARWRAIEETGGRSAGFRAAREAWEVLREPARRAAYERWWLRALGPLDGAQDRSTSGGGSGEAGGPAAASPSSIAAVASRSAATSITGNESEGSAASRARPSRSRRRAPRRLP